jgi:hypothetical protein
MTDRAIEVAYDDMKKFMNVATKIKAAATAPVAPAAVATAPVPAKIGP